MHSDIIKKGFERAPHRSLLRATGSIESDADFDKPFIAICNSYTDCIPGHAHLNEVGMLVKRLVREAGGVPPDRLRIVHDDSPSPWTFELILWILMAVTLAIGVGLSTAEWWKRRRS